MKSYEQYLEEERKNLDDVKTTKQDSINKTYDEQAKNTQNIYNSAINDSNIKYESDYERNAVQKLINEKMIAERNANLGLTDSGLNRTQQTAVQLSYANQKGAIDIAKQGALDELSQNLALSLSSIEQNRVTALADLDANIEAQAQSNAIDRYNADIAAMANYYTGSSSVYDGYINPDDVEVDENGNIIKIGGYNIVGTKAQGPTNKPTVTGFRTTKGDNFTITIGDNEYKVENEGKVESINTLKSIAEGTIYGNIIIASNGNAYIKNGNDYYRIGNLNGLFNIGVSSKSGYNDLLLALSK